MARTPNQSPPSPPPAPPAQPHAAEHEVFLREVDEAVRQEEVASLLRRHGWKIGGSVLAGLAVLGGYLFWQDRREGQLEAGSEALISALDELEAGNARIADEELAALIADDKREAARLALLARGGIALAADRREEAAGFFAQVADDADAPQQLRDLATIRLIAAQFDSLPPAEVIARLRPLAVPESPWFGSAGELVAFAYLAQGREDQAGPLLVAIAQNEDVPATLRARTRQLAGFLGFDAIEDVSATLQELGVAENAPQSAEGTPVQ